MLPSFVQLICSCGQHPQCKPVSTLRLELYRPMTPVLPVDERRLRHVAVSWAALGQAAACSSAYICGSETKAQGYVENLVSGRSGSVALFVGIRCGAISSDIRLSSQAARSIGLID